MRILLARPGSPTAVAAALAAGHPWPVGSAIRVVTVIEPNTAALSTVARFSEVMAAERHIRAAAEEEQADVLSRLAGRGWSVTGEIVHGHAVNELVAAAAAFRADLVIVGARLAWPWLAPDLSVARDLLDAAPCPVVVARRNSISRVVLATDGSPGAGSAEAHLVESPALAGLPILVVSVAETRHLLSAKFLPTIGEFDAHEVATRRAHHRGFAEDAAARLAAHGRDVDTDVRAGDIATEIASAVADSAADLVVLGSDDHRGLSRIVLGSVAREVLAQTDASVLVVRTRALASVAVQTGRRRPRASPSIPTG